MSEEIDNLCRKGEHKCPKCGTTTVMYYRPFCPACDEPTKHKGAINLFKAAYVLGWRYGKTYEEMMKLKGEYIDAFMEYCDHFRNDVVCDMFGMPQRSKDDDEETKRKLDRLEEIHMSYPFDRYLFWVSW